MKAVLIKMVKHPSKYGGDFYYGFFKDEEGNSFKVTIAEKYRNFVRWKPVLEKYKNNTGQEIWLDNLRVLKKNIIDSDSLFSFAKVEVPRLDN